MTFRGSVPSPAPIALVAIGLALLCACSGGTATPSAPIAGTPSGQTPGATTPAGPSTGPVTSPLPSTTETAAPTDAGSPDASQEPDATGGTTTGGDIPDNALFLTYKDTAHGFSIQYVEGWQVTQASDGVEIRDKDSSEIVQVVAPVTDIPAYIRDTDLPQLQQTDGFKLLAQDTMTIGGRKLDHLSYQQLSPPDPVTGKRIPSLVDRYYVSGPSSMAIVSLSTPKGVDNVDAFKQMIKSLKWM